MVVHCSVLAETIVPVQEQRGYHSQAFRLESPYPSKLLLPGSIP